MTTLSKPTIEGERYRATIPDTLDLADRTELALNGLGGSLDPELDYEMYFGSATRPSRPTCITGPSTPLTSRSLPSRFR